MIHWHQRLTGKGEGARQSPGQTAAPPRTRGPSCGLAGSSREAPGGSEGRACRSIRVTAQAAAAGAGWELSGGRDRTDGRVARSGLGSQALSLSGWRSCRRRSRGTGGPSRT